MTDVSPTRLTKDAAKALTARLRAGLEEMDTLVMEAQEGRVWEALGYKGWTAYVSGEFGKSRTTAYRLLDQAKVTRALGSGNSQVPRARQADSEIQVSARQAAVLKPVLATATAEIRELVAAGTPEKVAISTVVASVQAAKKSEGVANSPCSQPGATPTPSGATPTMDRQVLDDLRRYTDAEVRAIGDPWRPALENEIRRWAGLLGQSVTRWPSTDGGGTATRRAAEARLTRRDVQPVPKKAAKR